MASSFLRFLDQTQRRTTVSRTLLDEWLARHRDLYLTTHNTHNRQTSMPPVGFEPTISADERPQTYASDRAATGTGGITTIRCVISQKSAHLTSIKAEAWNDNLTHTYYEKRLLCVFELFKILTHALVSLRALTFRRLMSYIYIWSTHSWCF